MPISGNRNHPLRKAPEPSDPEYVEYGAPPPLRFHTFSEGMDQIALAVAHLPETMQPTHRKRLRIIARELMRRARAK